MKTTPTHLRRSSSHLLTFIAVAIGGFVLSLATTQAILIDFETSSGYTAGSAIDGQPTNGTKWANWSGGGDYADTIKIASGIGAGGGQAANSYVTATPGTYADKRFAPDDTDLGGVFDSTNSYVAFTMDLRWGSTNVSAIEVGRIHFGSDGFGERNVSLMWYSDGSIFYRMANNGGAYVQAMGGSTFYAATNTYYTISGIADYKTLTYSLNVNSVWQGDHTMTGTDTDPAAANYTVHYYSIGSSSVNFAETSVDNLGFEITPVPEPGVMGLLVVSLLAYGALRIKRRRA